MSADEIALDEQNNFRSSRIASRYDSEHERILAVFGFPDLTHVIGYSLSCIGPSQDLILTVEKYITKDELAALAEELEQNPPTKKETP